MSSQHFSKEQKSLASLFLVAIFFCFEASAQNEVAIGSSTTKSNAILWLNGNGSQGLILPIVTNKSAVTNPDKGMIVYDDSDNKVWYRNPTAWVEIGGGTGGSTASPNLLLQGNQLQLRDGTTVQSTVNIAGGTQANGSFMVFTGGSWQYATLSGDVTGANGALQVNGIKGKAVGALPATTQALVYDPAANTGAGGWSFQAIAGAPIVLNNGQILVGNGTVNSAATLSGDATLSAGAVTVVNNAITTAKINANAVDATKLADNAVTTIKVADNAITTAKINANAVDATKLADNAVTTIKVADNAITTAKINANAVDATKLADNSVTSVKVANSAITTAKINANAVDATKLADGSVTNLKIANNAVTSVNITDATVTSADIAAATITGGNIAATTITADKLAQSTAANGQVLKWNGTNWVPQNDDAGVGTTPTLANGQILIGNGTTNSAALLSGDATLSAGALTIANNAVTNLKIANDAVTSAKILDATITGADVAGATITGSNIAATTITDANINATANIAATKLEGTVVLDSEAPAAGDITGNFGAGLQLAANSVTTAEITNATITGADIAATTITDANINAAANIAVTKIAPGVNGNVLTTVAGIPTWQAPSASTDAQDLTLAGTTLSLTNDGTPVTLGGLSILSTVTSAEITNATITGADIAATTITGSNIANATITGGNIAATTITGGNIAATTIAGGNLAAGSVSGGIGGTITDASITGADIAATTITGANIAATTITPNKLAPGVNNDVLTTVGGVAVWQAPSASTDAQDLTLAGTTLSLTNDGTPVTLGGLSILNTVSTGEITNATITGADIAATTITGGNIANATITGANIAATTIAAGNLAAGSVSGGVGGTITDASITADDLAVGSVNLATTDITGILPVANGGTGAATLTGVLIGNGTSPLTTAVHSGANQYLRRNGANSAYEFGDLTLQSGDIVDGTIMNIDINAAAAISGTKVNPNFGTQNISTTGTVTATSFSGSGAALTGITVGDNTITGGPTGAGVKIQANTITNDNINAAAGIVDTKLATISTAGKVSGNAINTGTIGGNTAINTTGNITTTGTGTLNIAGTSTLGGTLNVTGATTLGNLTGVGTRIIVTGATGLLTPVANGTGVLTNDGTGNFTWGSSGWGLTGNNTIASDFLGTINAQDFVLKTSNVERMRVLALGNVGIGTATPNNPLSVQGSMNIDNGNAYNGTINNTLRFGSGTDAAIGGGAFGSGRLDLFTLGSPRLTINNTGNVGIGTTVPTELLHVNGATTGKLRLTNNTIGSAITDGLELDIDNTGTGHLQTRETGMMIVGAGGNNVIHITPGGLVGLNNASPTAGLDISGTVKIVDGTQAAGRVLTSDVNGLASWQAPSGGGWGLTGNTLAGTERIGSDNAQPLAFETSNTERMRIDATGKVGIGNTAPVEKLTITAGNAHVDLNQSFGFDQTAQGMTYDGKTTGVYSLGWTMDSWNTFGGTGWLSAYSGLKFFTNGAFPRMSILQDGKVGIGNIAPTEALDVTGNVKFSGALMPNNLAGTAGQVLTSAGAGVPPTWSPSGGSGWGLTGNAGTVDATNFIGTTDAVPLNFKVNNQKAGRIEHATPFNTFYGYQTGNSGTPGTDNAIIGYQAGVSNTGNYNVFIGSQAGQNKIGGSQNTLIGWRAGRAASNGGNTMVGASAGLATTTGNVNTFIGQEAGMNNIGGTTNVFIGNSSGITNITGHQNVLIGNNSDVGASGLLNASAIGYRAFVNQSNSLVLGGINGVNGAIANTNVGIGTSTPSEILHVVGNSKITGNIILGAFNETIIGSNNEFLFSAFLNPDVDNVYQIGQSDKRWSSIWASNGTINTSDVRQKKDIKNINYGLSEILKLRPVSFVWKTGQQNTKLGLIAQETLDVLPEVVTVPKNDKEFYGMNYSDIIPVLIKAIQEQQEIIVTMKGTEAESKKKIATLEASLQNMQSTSSDMEKLKAEIETIKRTLGIEASTKKK
jgi:uncharacterized protein YjbI with pentapeptide repeats